MGTRFFPTTIGILLSAAILASVASCDLVRQRSDLETLAATPLTTESDPWYVVHGLVAGGPDLALLDSASGASVEAVDHLTRERHLRDRDGKVISSPYLEEGLPRFPRTDGQYVAEGHPNQFLAALTGAGVPLSHSIEMENGDRHTLADALEHVKRNLRPSQIRVDPPKTGHEDHELGWSIGLLADAVGTDAKWTNKWGEDVSLDALVEIAIQRPIGWGSCGGTHELYGLVRALRAHRAVHTELSGVWERLARYLDDAKARARASQHSDGSFDYEWHVSPPSEPATNNGLNRQVHITGHMLEWLALAASPEEIDAPYLKQAYEFLEGCRFADVALGAGQRAKDEVSYGPLTHAVHAMRLYREKLAASHPHTGKTQG